jgi:hypothetical protein
MTDHILISFSSAMLPIDVYLVWQSNAIVSVYIQHWLVQQIFFPSLPSCCFEAKNLSFFYMNPSDNFLYNNYSKNYLLYWWISHGVLISKELVKLCLFIVHFFILKIGLHFLSLYEVCTYWINVSIHLHCVNNVISKSVFLCIVQKYKLRHVTNIIYIYKWHIFFIRWWAYLLVFLYFYKKKSFSFVVLIFTKHDYNNAKYAPCMYGSIWCLNYFHCFTIMVDIHIHILNYCRVFVYKFELRWVYY